MFRVASEIEYRLRITPRSVRLQPSAFDRRILRLFVVAMPTMIVVLFIGDRGTRIRALFTCLVLVCVAIALLLLLDAMPSVRRGKSKPAAAPRPPSPRPPVSKPPAGKQAPPRR